MVNKKLMFAENYEYFRNATWLDFMTSSTICLLECYKMILYNEDTRFFYKKPAYMQPSTRQPKI